MWIFLFALISPFTPFLDMYVSDLFYSPVNGFHNNWFFHFMFKYGELFGIGTGMVASAVCIVTFVFPSWKKYRQGCFAMVFTLVIGAGLITNVGLKGYWGRPRPKQVIEFGGKHQYRPFWKPDLHTCQDPQKSFPSGHAAMGFYFFSLCLVGRRYRSKFVFRTGVVLTLFFGCGLMLVRVAQGGHFVSDVLASPLIMWYVARGADWLFFTWGESGQKAYDSSQSGTFRELDKA